MFPLHSIRRGKKLSTYSLSIFNARQNWWFSFSCQKAKLKHMFDRKNSKTHRRCFSHFWLASCFYFFPCFLNSKSSIFLKTLSQGVFPVSFHRILRKLKNNFISYHLVFLTILILTFYCNANTLILHEVDDTSC